MQALTKISLPFSFSYVSNDLAIDRQVEQAIAKYPRNHDILRKIGVTQKEVKRSVSRQMLLLFALPLVLGSCHYLVAMRILSAIFPNANFVVPTLTTLTGYVVIYLGYYLLTTRSYYGMVMTK
jgi:putative ABC transport system permease protein